MGFLDKLKLSGDKSQDLPPPPTKAPSSNAQSSAKQDPSQTPKDLPPLPSNTPTNKPTITEPPKLELPAKHDDAAANPLDAPSMQKPETDTNTQPSTPPKQPSQTATPSQKPQVPPPPAPAQSSRTPRSVSDIPPIKVNQKDDSRQGIITDRHVEDLDVNNLVLPGEEDEDMSIVQAPVQQKEKPAPPPRKPAPRPQRRMPQPEDTQPAYTGPLYVDVPTYEDVQQGLTGLKNDLQSVSADVENISNLNKKESEEFDSLVKRLERIQDHVLSIDKSLFEEK